MQLELQHIGVFMSGEAPYIRIDNIKNTWGFIYKRFTDQNIHQDSPMEVPDTTYYPFSIFCSNVGECHSLPHAFYIFEEEI